MSGFWCVQVDEVLMQQLLDSFQMGPIIEHDGQELFILEEVFVAELCGLKFELFSNEHPPPHFRIIYNGQSNNFTIKDCQPLNGNGLKKFFKNIQKWHIENKVMLIETWNRTRPSDCPVGMYRE